MPKFGPWTPDQGSFSDGPTDVTNVRTVGEAGYGSARGLGVYSNAAPNGYLRGFAAAKDNAGANSIFAGDVGDLLEQNFTTGDLDVVSKAGGYTLSDEDFWDFVTFGNYLIAAHGFDDILQQFQLGISSLFADITGAPAARYVAVIKDQVMAANVKYGGNEFPYRAYWSALNDHTSWTIGTNQSDIQDLADAGHITGIVGGDEGLILCERALFRALYVGSPLIFQFDRADIAHGCRIPGSVAALSPTQVYFFSNQGFVVWNGQFAQAIGAQRVDAFFRSDLNNAYLHRVSSTINVKTNEIMWSYPDQDSVDGTPNKILTYNYLTQRWSKLSLAHERLGTIITAATSLEALDNLFTDIDSIPGSLDDAIYRGGIFLAAGSLDNKIATFNAAALDAEIVTSEFSPGRSTTGAVTGFLPSVEGSSAAEPPVITASLGSRKTQSEAVVYRNAVAMNKDAVCPIRGSERYLRIKIGITGEWDVFHQFEIISPRRGRRRK